jgi:thymidylate synthase (FAD)
MVELKFLVRVPMDCWRQWIRHRTASINETSTRYSIAIDAAQQTPPNAWRKQAISNRQGSEGCFDETAGGELTAEESDLQQRARQVYRRRIERGVAREQARKDLPLATYTEAYWKIDLHNLLHFLELRMDVHAQWEIRQYAETMGREIVAPLLPLAWEAFVDYRTEGMTLSRLEQGVVARLLAAGKAPADEEAFLAAGDPAWSGLARCRERDECREKLVRLGIVR